MYFSTLELPVLENGRFRHIPHNVTTLSKVRQFFEIQKPVSSFIEWHGFWFMGGLLCLCSVMLMAQAVQAGAWTQPMGRALVIQNQFIYSSDEYVNADGTQSDALRFAKTELNPYIEYGLFDDWTLGGSAFIQKIRQETPSGNSVDNFGHGGLEFFVRHQLYRTHGWALSVQPLLKFKAHYEDKNGPKSGHGNVEAELALQGGYGFEARGLPHYVEGKLAYRKRTGGLSNQWRASAGAGLPLFSRLTVMPELHYTHAVTGLYSSGASASGQNDYHLANAQLSFLFRINQYYQLQLGAYRPIYARNTGVGDGFVLSIWHQR